MELRYLLKENGEKVLLKIIKPFWFFFYKTWIGGILIMILTLFIPIILISLILPNIMHLKGDEAKGIGQGLGIFSIMLSPFIAMPLITIGDYLNCQYNKSINS